MFINLTQKQVIWIYEAACAEYKFLAHTGFDSHAKFLQTLKTKLKNEYNKKNNNIKRIKLLH